MLYPPESTLETKSERRKGFAGYKGIRQERQSQEESVSFVLVGPIRCNLLTSSFTLSFHFGTKIAGICCSVSNKLTGTPSWNTSGTLSFVLPSFSHWLDLTNLPIQPP